MGLFLEGAGWDDSTQTLAESQPKELFLEMPVLHLQPCESSKKVVKHCYRCPVYKTSARRDMLSTTGHSTNFVIMTELLIKEQDLESHWIKRGTAMLTQLDT